MRAAALVLLRPRLAVLVGADRDVLRAVVGRELASAQRERRGREREDAVTSSRAAGRSEARSQALQDDRASPSIDASTCGRSHGSSACGQRALDLRQQGERLGQPRGAAQDRVLDDRAAEPLAPRDDLQLAVVVRTAQAQAVGPVHEHAVCERHASEPDRRSLTPRSVA